MHAQPNPLRESFEKAARRELPVLYRVAKRLTLDAHQAEDLVGQALLSAAKAWPHFDGRHERSWLLTILRNEHLQNVRRPSARVQTTSIEETHAVDHSAWEALSDRSDVQGILEELDKLPEEFRMAVTLCDVEGLSYEEAAEAMKVKIGTVRSRLFRGRRTLRDKLQGKGWTP